MTDLQLQIGERTISAQLTDEQAWRLIQTLDAPVGGSLADLERWYIQLVLQAAGNYKTAAMQLGITTKTLWLKRQEYGLD